MSRSPISSLAALLAIVTVLFGCSQAEPGDTGQGGTTTVRADASPSVRAQQRTPVPQRDLPVMRLRGLSVRGVTGGLSNPTSMAFIARDDILVLQKDDGKVRRVIKGVLQPGSVLDVNVHSSSERGLLGIALHPRFPRDPSVYLYYTQSPSRDTSSFGVRPLGNRVFRYRWTGSRLVSPKLILDLPATPGPNHDGGIIGFGPDGKLYVVIGELNQRGQTSNVRNGSRPDNAHLVGVIVRINPDGTIPADNPFAAVGSRTAGTVGVNLRKIFAYGIRNSFGFAFDPKTGNLWDTENGEQTFDEINLVRKGFNSGWIQVMGPLARIKQFKTLEGGLVNFDVRSIGDTPQAVRARMFVLPGSAYSDPEFSWKHAVAPTAIGFQKGAGLGAAFDGDLFVGDFSTGSLYRFDLTANRQSIVPPSADLRDLVADNSPGDLLGEARSAVVGTDFGILTDLESGPNGNLFAVSLSKGAIFEITRTP